MRVMFVSFEGDVSELTNAIVNHGYMTRPEIVQLAESITEDIVCSLFLWNSGTYRFNSLRNVEALVPAGISIPVENIVMEAMRRIDEWHRMLEFISEQSIFVKVQKDAEGDFADPLHDPAGYIYYRVDGTSPVKEFVSASCLTEYKIYESLYSNLQSGKITPLSDRISRSVQAALQKKDSERSTSHFSTLFSIIITVGIILFLILISWIIFKGIIFPETSTKSYLGRVQLSISQVDEKVAVARLHYRAFYGSEPESTDDLKTFRLINENDISYLKLKSQIDPKNGELLLKKKIVHLK